MISAFSVSVHIWGACVLWCKRRVMPTTLPCRTLEPDHDDARVRVNSDLVHINFFAPVSSHRNKIREDPPRYNTSVFQRLQHTVFSTVNK